VGRRGSGRIAWRWPALFVAALSLPSAQARGQSTEAEGASAPERLLCVAEKWGRQRNPEVQCEGADCMFTPHAYRSHREHYVVFVVHRRAPGDATHALDVWQLPGTTTATERARVLRALTTWEDRTRFRAGAGEVWLGRATAPVRLSATSESALRIEAGPIRTSHAREDVRLAPVNTRGPSQSDGLGVPSWQPRQGRTDSSSGARATRPARIRLLIQWEAWDSDASQSTLSDLRDARCYRAESVAAAPPRRPTPRRQWRRRAPSRTTTSRRRDAGRQLGRRAAVETAGELNRPAARSRGDHRVRFRGGIGGVAREIRGTRLEVVGDSIRGAANDTEWLVNAELELGMSVGLVLEPDVTLIVETAGAFGYLPGGPGRETLTAWVRPATTLTFWTSREIGVELDAGAAYRTFTLARRTLGREDIDDPARGTLFEAGLDRWSVDAGAGLAICIDPPRGSTWRCDHRVALRASAELLLLDEPTVAPHLALTHWTPAGVWWGLDVAAPYPIAGELRVPQPAGPTFTVRARIWVGAHVGG